MRQKTAPHTAPHKELKRHKRALQFFPVFVFHSIPLVHGRVSPDISTPHVERVGEVPDCADTLILCKTRLFASRSGRFLGEFFSRCCSIFYS